MAQQLEKLSQGRSFTFDTEFHFHNSRQVFSLLKYAKDRFAFGLSLNCVTSSAYLPLAGLELRIKFSLYNRYDVYRMPVRDDTYLG